jgi:hypothetical protein
MAIDRKTGKTVWERMAREQEPHEGSHVDNGTWASGSPITDGQHVFAYFESFPGRDGTTIVIRSGPTYEVLAKNTLDDGFDASPALVDNELYLRGYRFLYSIAQQ